ncbi:PucR family transcriptional regulator, partial [Streptomyces sp. SID2563]|nr:PucR family transcriptional regulator [Streptomyces sp. SID2563]
MAEPVIPDSFLEGYAQILGEVAVSGRRLTREELDSRRTLGREAAEAGHQLRALVRMHLAETRAAWP